MSIKNLNPIKKRILFSAAISFPICCFFLYGANETGKSNSIDGAAFIFMMVILGNLTALICLIVWLTILVNSRFTQYVFPIFISTHTAVWGIGWFVGMCALTFLREVEDKIALFFLFPMIVGILSLSKIFRSIPNHTANSNGNLPWPPTENK